MSSYKRPSDGLHCSSPSKINCSKTQIHKSSVASESILTENIMDSVEVMEGPEKSQNDKKSYLVIRLPNNLKALLISDPTQKNEESDEEPDDEKPKLSEAEQMITTDEEEEEDSESEASDDESHKEHKEKRGKLAACALCVDVGSFSDPRDVQGLAHFLGKSSSLDVIFYLLLHLYDFNV